MLPLQERLAALVQLLEDSNADLQVPEADKTGFIPVLPELLVDAVLHLLQYADTKNVSLDLGCGNGGWLLVAAAAGYPSYGIEINPLLVEHARKNYDLAVAFEIIDPRVPCKVVCGDMIPARFAEEYDVFRQKHQENQNSMPSSHESADLPVDISTADIVYCWAWPTQSRFIFNMFEKTAKRDAFFVLPCYLRYTQGEHMNAMLNEKNTLILSELAQAKDVFVGRRG
jgi:SAM-dependent methyltransferase